MSQPPFRLRLLGPVIIAGPGAGTAAPPRLTQPRPLAVLTYLALARPRGLQPRHAIMALLWPEHDEERARRGLRNALHALRRALDPRALLSIGEDLIGLDPQWVTCDVHDLEQGRVDPEAAAAGVEPMHGLHVDDAPEFAHWLDAERTRLRSLLARHRTAAPAASPTRAARLPRVETSDAFAWYVRGHYCFLRAAHDGDLGALEHARRCYERALERDPDFAPAVAGLSNYYAVAARRGLIQPFEAGWHECIALAHRTLALSDTSGIPPVHLGAEALYLLDDFDRAGTEFARAVAKDPDYAEGHRFLAIWLGMAGRHREAVLEAEAAVRLEPEIVTMVNTLGAIRWQAGDLDGAKTALRETLAIDPRQTAARERLLRILEREGRFAEAVAERLNGPPAFRGAAFAAAWAASGEAGYREQRRHELRDEVQRIESRLVEGQATTINDRYAPPVLRLVAALTELGETAKARAWRLQAVAERPILARWFDAMPELARVPQ